MTQPAEGLCAWLTIVTSERHLIYHRRQTHSAGIDYGNWKKDVTHWQANNTSNVLSSLPRICAANISSLVDFRQINNMSDCVVTIPQHICAEYACHALTYAHHISAGNIGLLILRVTRDCK
ncbi:unnamed protein product [Ostreobium quekettii]|uniref:Uncharacterized protein n=1 Tax=Ostreobium quekettii TaxID=121088 RepID=A0A8S1J2H9_9CHLO|nr:unnamed protein product [Ostreobium quekettii]